MKNIILSIKDKYVQKILNKEKLYEFRGWIWKENVRHVYIYASGRIRKIIARFEVDLIDKGTPIEVWEKYKDNSVVNKEEFFKYVNNFDYKEIYVIKIKKLEKLIENNYINLDIIRLQNAPQRFKYLNSEEDRILQRFFK